MEVKPHGSSIFAKCIFSTTSKSYDLHICTNYLQAKKFFFLDATELIDTLPKNEKK